MISLLVMGPEFFQTTAPRLEANPLLVVPILGAGLIGLPLLLWQFVLTLLTLSEVFAFSVWKALASYVGATLVIAVR